MEEEAGGDSIRYEPAEKIKSCKRIPKYISPKLLFVLFKLRKSLFP
jgi:hypothetical protein